MDHANQRDASEATDPFHYEGLLAYDSFTITTFVVVADMRFINNNNVRPDQADSDLDAR